MPSTITTNENYSLTIDQDRLKEEVKLRLKAGAIRSWFEHVEDHWVLYTEWNVIGE